MLGLVSTIQRRATHEGRLVWFARDDLEFSRSRLAGLALLSAILLISGLFQVAAVVVGNLGLVVASSLTLFVVALAAPILLPATYPLVVVPLYLFRNVGYLAGLSTLPVADPTAFALRASLATPDLVLLMMIAVHALTTVVFRPTRKLLSGTLVAASFAVLMSLAFALSDADATQKLAYLRSFLLPVAIFAAGLAAPTRVLKQSFHFIVAGVLVCAALGTIAYGVGSIWGWSHVGRAYFEFKHGGFSAVTGVPGIWQTTFFGLRLPRFGGTLLDPIAFGYWSVAATTLALVHRRFVLAAVCCFLAVISLSKGAILGIALVAVIGLWWSSERRSDLRIMALGAAVAASIALIWLVDEGKGSLWVHLEGLVAGVASAFTHPAGHGLGLGGNWSGILGAGTDLATGAESGLGVIAYQLGLAGLLPVAFFFIWQTVIRVRSPVRDWPSGASLGLVVTVAVMLAFQENALSASASFPLWWLLGLSSPRRDADVRAT